MSEIIECPSDPLIGEAWIDYINALQKLMQEEFGESCRLRKLDTIMSCITILNSMEDDLFGLLYAASRYTKGDAELDELRAAAVDFGRCVASEKKNTEQIFTACFDYYPEDFPAMCITEQGNDAPVLLVDEAAIHALEICTGVCDGRKYILYSCNGKACAPKTCYSECSHTVDINFARNFDSLSAGDITIFVERDRREGTE